MVEQEKIDKFMLELDGTENKCKSSGSPDELQTPAPLTRFRCELMSKHHQTNS